MIVSADVVPLVLLLSLIIVGIVNAILLWRRKNTLASAIEAWKSANDAWKSAGEAWNKLLVSEKHLNTILNAIRARNRAMARLRSTMAGNKLGCDYFA